MTRVYENAFTEVYEIINCLNDDDYKKIPKSIIRAIEENRNEDYTFFINESLPLIDQEISHEAKAILFNLFRDYLSTDEQKNRIENIQKKDKIKHQEELREKYNPDDIFKNRHKEVIEETKEQENVTTMVEYKESIFSKFVNFIKRLFK